MPDGGRGVKSDSLPGVVYPPQYPGYPPYPYMQPMRPQRSGVPRVMGILAIIFACVGLAGSAIWTFGPLSDLDKHSGASELEAVTAWLWIWMGLSAVVFVVHLIGGILSVQYKRAGLKIMTVYGIVALALAIVDCVLVVVLMPEKYRSNGGADDLWFSVATMHIFFEVMALPWPITALALANGARAKEACGTPTASAADVF